ncbi:MAG TPA: hypothetical protein VJN94_06670 [Candidatus Binataceae bacterium]|nr:hypothetical protein [Candidatus Binataceae bacterium]
MNPRDILLGAPAIVVPFMLERPAFAHRVVNGQKAAMNSVSSRQVGLI